MLGHWAWKLLGGTMVSATGVYGVAHHYRPMPDHSSPRAVQADQQPLSAGTRTRSVDIKDGDPMVLQAVRALTMATGAALLKTVMGLLNEIAIVQDHRHAAWLRAIRKRESDVPLITVANHESCFDDPGLMAGIVPWDTVADPRRMRWGICTQDICFPDNKVFIQAVAGAGQALPIRRGGGIDQPLFFDVARHVAAGHWVHVFPEGRVIQSGDLGMDVLTRRSQSELSSVGRLKWGVGKLIAHSPRTPIIIPMHHSGMPTVIPQHNMWRPDGKGGKWWDNRIKSPVPQFGQTVRVRFGEQIFVDDLIREFESKHGPLRKISWRPEDLQKDWEWWANTTSHERKLYSAITKRIEEGMLRLQKEATAAAKQSAQEK